MKRVQSSRSSVYSPPENRITGIAYKSRRQFALRVDGNSIPTRIKNPRRSTLINALNDSKSVSELNELHLLSSAFAHIGNHKGNYFVGLKKDVLNLAKTIRLARSQLNAATQDLCESSGFVVIVILSKSGASLFRPGRKPQRVFVSRDRSNGTFGTEAVRDCIIEGLKTENSSIHDIVSLIRAALARSMFLLE